MWGKFYRDRETVESMASSCLKPRKPYPTRLMMVTAETSRDLFVVNDVDAAPSNLSWRWIDFESPKLLPCRVHVFAYVRGEYHQMRRGHEKVSSCPSKRRCACLERPTFIAFFRIRYARPNVNIGKEKLLKKAFVGGVW